MSAVVSIDGVLGPAAEARVPALDRGFLAGDQVYEVVRTYGLVPFELDAHLDRLARSAARIALDLPWTAARLAAEVRRAVEASRGGDAPDPAAAPWNHGERGVRLVVTRGAGPEAVALGLPPGPRVLVFALPLLAPPLAAYREGVACVLVAPRAARVEPGAKTGSHLAEALAARDAAAAGAHEALLVDAEGRVTEGASSNLFAVRGGRLWTPPADAAILPGVTRALVLALAAEAGLPAEERPLAAGEVRAADELFLTSTSRELLPVTRLDGLPVGDGRPGPVTRALHARYRGAADRAARAG